jgi:hypothetical protein
MSLLLVYRKNAKYAAELPSIASTLDAIRERWGTQYKLVETDTLSTDGADKLRAQIREVIPQSRGRIVSSGGNVLPLSHGRRLNVENTPILLLYVEGRPIQVYPHMLGKEYASIEKGLRQLLEEGPRQTVEERGLVEPSIERLLAGHPTLLGEGASCNDVEVDVGAGVADLVLSAKDGRPIVVEVKIHADDSAIGQVSRIAEAYATRQSLDHSTVRKAIACLTYAKNLDTACRGAGVELYELKLSRIE